MHASTSIQILYTVHHRLHSKVLLYICFRYALYLFYYACRKYRFVISFYITNKSYLCMYVYCFTIKFLYHSTGLDSLVWD